MSPLKLTALIQIFSLLKVPLLGILRPKVVHLTATQSRIRLPLSHLAKNHVGSMYFGALAIGAELSVALKVVDSMQNDKTPVNFIFKDFSCQFLQRAEGATDFCCDEVPQIQALIDKALATQERVEGKFNGYACPRGAGRDEQLMTYQLTLSIKSTKKRK
ncbi:MAG: DUF4442 domain-containing protein [Bdellovibrionales bacterium]